MLKAGAIPVAAGRLRVWLIIGTVGFGTMLHYGDMLPVLADAADGSPVSLAYRQSLERILFLLPVMYAAYVFGVRGGLGTLAATGAILLPRALTGDALDHAVPEVGGVLVVGTLLTRVIVQQQADVMTQKKLHESVSFFIRQVLTAQEDERNRLALELHDETAQELLVISQRLDRLSEREDARTSPGLRDELQSVRTSVVRTLADLRRLSQGLRPRILDDLGLEAALEWLADELGGEYGIRIRVEVDARLSGYSRNVQLLLFRIAQEALRNVVRHAGASQATISVRGDGDRLTMTIADDGRGFQMPSTLSDLASTGRLGLAGMSERVRLLGGILNIRSSPGKGSIIEIDVPHGAANASTGPVSSEHRSAANTRVLVRT
jgi:signal transduction histidine kinase